MKNILLYGVVLGILLLLLQLSAYRFVIIDHATEIYAGIVAIIFTAIGIWMGLKLTQRKKEVIIIEKGKPSTFILNEAELERRGISKRELEVLQLMAKGMSNQEIAEKLFVSLNTVKTHSSNIFMKMNVKRRTQAIQRAKECGLLP